MDINLYKLLCAHSQLGAVFCPIGTSLSNNDVESILFRDNRLSKQDDATSV